MKSAIILLGVAAFAVSTSPRGCGEDAGAPAGVSVPPLPGIGSATVANDEAGPPASVRVDVQMVSVSAAEARHLVPAFRDRKTADAAWDQVQRMIGRGEAKLLAWPVLWLQSSRRLAGLTIGFPTNFPIIVNHGATESIEEVRYPTEFTPPQVSTVFGSFPPTSPTWGVDSNTPTAFEARDVGATLCAEAKVERGGQVITLNVSSRLVRLDGFRRWRNQRSPSGIQGLQEQPNFQISNVMTQLSVHRDQPVLIGVFVLSDPVPHVELSILHGWAKLLPPNAVIPPSK